MNKGIALIDLIVACIFMAIICALAVEVCEEDGIYEEKIYCPTCGHKLVGE